MSLDDFAIRRASKDGRQSICRRCHSEGGKAAKFRETQRTYQQRNRTTVSTKRKAYNRLHRERFKDAHDAYRAKRRALLKDAPEVISKRVVWLRDKGICGICSRKVRFQKMSLDHIIPLSKGGLHTYANVQTSHLPCNLRKGTKVDGQP